MTKQEAIKELRRQTTLMGVTASNKAIYIAIAALEKDSEAQPEQTEKVLETKQKTKYVSADIVHDRLRSLCDKYKISFGNYGGFGEEIAKLSQELPAADIDPESIRPKGKWIVPKFTTKLYFVCSHCGKVEEHSRKYCPNCGTRMDMEGA